jgi:glycerol-3-phosphate dehydrogenase
MTEQFDIAIIGGGCVGSAIAQRLCKYDVKLALLEKEADVAMGATKANSGIIHSGYFFPKGSKKEKYNLRGAPMFDQVCKQIGVDFARPGALFCASDEDEIKILREEKELAKTRQIPFDFIEDKAKIHELEPVLNSSILAALFFPTAGIIVPFEFTVGLAEHAVMNGTTLYLGFNVVTIENSENGFIVTSEDKRTIIAKSIVNAAGVYSDKIANMVGLNSFQIKPRRGEYIMLDKGAIPLNHVLFPTPTGISKGILVSMTMHGNIFMGPNAQEIDHKEENSTTTAGLNEIITGARKLVSNIPTRLAITNFAGVRATTAGHDFIVEATKVPQFVNAAGIDSPGLSSCLAIAEAIEEILEKDCKYKFILKTNYIPKRNRQIRFKDLREEELAQRISENPQWGQMICRCESVTEAEIVAACHAPIPASNTDMIKRRLRPGMGRCQGGFCLPKVMKIISRELHVPYLNVTKTGNKSIIVTGRSKKLESEIFKGTAL